MTSSTSSSERSRGPSWPLALLIALGIVAIIEGSVYVTIGGSNEKFYPPDRIPLIEESIAQWQIHHLLREAGPQNVLLLGDSSGLMGLRTRLIMEQTGLEVWNAATIGSLGIQGHVRTLDLYLKRFGPPDLVVYHISSYPLITPLRVLKRKRRFNYFMSWVDRLEGSAAQLPPSLALREAAQAMFISATKGRDFLSEPRPPYASDNDVRDELLAGRGSMSEPKREDFGRPRPIVGQMLDGPESELDELFSRAGKHGFPIVLMMCPVPEVSNNHDTIATFAHIEQRILELVKRYPKVALYEPFLRVYPTDRHARLKHLTDQGAIENSMELVTWMRANGYAPAPEAEGVSR